MYSLLALPPRLWRWLVRFRHRCGYGIHSPFAFNFVTGVIYERGQYYAYDSLSRTCRPHNERPALRRRDLRLLFRIANAATAQNLLLAAHDGGRAERYIAAARPHARRRTTVPTREAMRQALLPPQEIDFLYTEAELLDAELLSLLLSKSSPHAYIVLHAIHRNEAARTAWALLQADRRIRVTFDLHDFGIACLEARLNKENYLINYF